MTCGSAALLLIGASLARNVVFWPHSGAPVTAALPGDPAPKFAPHASLPLRVTGRLRANAKTAGRFLNVPARTVLTKEGALAIAATVAPRREPGVGEWLLLPSGPFTTRNGLLAYGTKLYPAFKIDYSDALDEGRRASAIFACDDEATRAALLARFHTGAPDASSSSGVELIR